MYAIMRSSTSSTSFLFLVGSVVLCFIQALLVSTSSSCCMAFISPVTISTHQKHHALTTSSRHQIAVDVNDDRRRLVSLNVFSHQQYHHGTGQNTQQQVLRWKIRRMITSQLLLSPNDDDTNQEPRMHPSGNPYADPNYPDLEFINYDDPEYQVDQGSETWGMPTTTQQDGTMTIQQQQIKQQEDEVLLEGMREERRKRNDEYQFQTYYKDVLKNGIEFHGEWTVYKTSTFLSTSPESTTPSSTTVARTLPTSTKMQREPPKLIQITKSPTLRVMSYGYKDMIETSSVHSTDERIRHSEALYVDNDDESNNDDNVTNEKYIDTDSGLGKSSSDAGGMHSPITTTTTSAQITPSASTTMKEEIVKNTYWPTPLAPIDFRGDKGIMVCGNAYTICTAVNLYADDTNKDTEHLGPFSEYRAELGIQENNVRLRLKFDYSILGDLAITSKSSPPPLHLKSMTVCREAVGMFPSSKSTSTSSVNSNPFDDAIIKEAFFGGKTGAEGGLYDPPPIRVEEQASQYMLLDLVGKATVLFPYIIDQDPTAHNGEGWVHSLDWSPTNMRYQVDRKVNGGVDLLGLRTLELSEVQSADAETYRPRDGGQNMRQ